MYSNTRQQILDRCCTAYMYAIMMIQCTTAAAVLGTFPRLHLDWTCKDPHKRASLKVSYHETSGKLTWHSKLVEFNG